MLQVTEAAMGALKALRTESEASDDAAARFQLMTAGGRQGIGFAFPEDPIEGDQKVADDGGLQVYVAPELAEPLSGAVVDARNSEAGTELFLRDQAAPGTPS